MNEYIESVERLIAIGYEQIDSNDEGYVDLGEALNIYRSRYGQPSTEEEGEMVSAWNREFVASQEDIGMALDALMWAKEVRYGG